MNTRNIIPATIKIHAAVIHCVVGIEYRISVLGPCVGEIRGVIIVPVKLPVSHQVILYWDVGHREYHA